MLKSIYRRVCGVVLGTSVLLTTGCTGVGPEFAEATGTVIYEGKPVPGATVTFLPEGGPPAIGNTDEQGEFRLNTNGKPVAFIGTHRVAIVAMKDSRVISDSELSNMTPKQLYQIRKSLIPWKYMDSKTSGLTATVTSDQSKNHFKLELERGRLTPPNL